MKNPNKNEVRKAYILDILVRIEDKSLTTSQRDIVKKVCIEAVKCDKNKGLDKKVNIFVSKTLKALEDEGIIIKTPLKIKGKRGPAQNFIRLNRTLESLYKILKAYDEALFTDYRYSLVLKYNLLISEYYKSLVNMGLVDKLTSLSGLPFTEEDKKLIYNLIKVSPSVLQLLFYEVYDREDFTYVVKPGGGYKKSFEKDEREKKRLKEEFIKLIQVDLIVNVFRESYVPGHNIEVDIKAKFKDKDGKEIFNFSNHAELDLEMGHVHFPLYDLL